MKLVRWLVDVGPHKKGDETRMSNSDYGAYQRIGYVEMVKDLGLANRGRYRREWDEKKKKWKKINL